MVCGGVAAGSMAKHILACLGERKRPVEFQTQSDDDSSGRDTLLLSIREVFADVLSPDTEIFLQIKSEEWQGEFVDLGEGAVVPDRAVLRVIPAEKKDAEVCCDSVTLLFNSRVVASYLYSICMLYSYISML